MSRVDILGWTLAELALTLLFALIAILLPAFNRNERRIRTEDSSVNAAGKLQTQVAHLSAENQQLQASLLEARKNLRSTAKPSCVELAKGPDYLFTATIKPDGRYEVEGKSFSIDGLLSAYRNELESANREGCVERIRVFYAPGVGTQQYFGSLQRLSMTFYPLPLGPR